MWQLYKHSWAQFLFLQPVSDQRWTLASQQVLITTTLHLANHKLSSLHLYSALAAADRVNTGGKLLDLAHWKTYIGLPPVASLIPWANSFYMPKGKSCNTGYIWASLPSPPSLARSNQWTELWPYTQPIIDSPKVTFVSNSKQIKCSQLHLPGK